MLDFNNIVNSLSIAIIVVKRGRIKFVNESALTILSAKEEELLDHKFEDLIFKLGTNKYSSFKSALKSRKKSGTYFEIKIAKDSSSAPVDVGITINDILFEGQSAKLLEVRDISEELEKLLFQKITKQIEDAVYGSRNFVELFVQVHKILDREIGAKNFYIAFYHKKDNTLTFPYFVDQTMSPPKRIKARQNLTEYTIKSKKPQLISDADYNELTKKGKVKLHGTRHAIWLGVPLKTESNDVLGVIVVQDYENPFAYGEKEKRLLTAISPAITDAILKVRAASELKQSEKEYRAVFENAHDAIIIFDPFNEIILDANSKAGKMYKVPKDELIGKSLKEFSKNVKIGEQRINFTIEHGEIESFDTVHIDAEGNEIPLEVNAAVIDFHKRKAILSILRDISDRKRAEEKLTKYIEELENSHKLLQKNADDLSKLNEKIRSSEEMLIATNSQKDLFFSIVAHDLRSPFNSMLGFTQYLVQELDSLELSEIREFVLSIDKSARNVFNLLENLLQWSKLNSSSFELSTTKVNLETVVHEVVNLFAATAFRKKIAISASVSSEIDIFTDQNMLNTVLRNLLSNAIKFTQNGGEIKIYSRINKSGVSIFVEDDGVGMTKTELKNIFNMDKRISKTGTSKETGIGLGMVLCKDFVDKLGGKLEVQSEKGKGSKFKISL